MRSLRLFSLGLTAAAALTLCFALNPAPVAAAPGQAWLGVSLQDLDRDLRDALDLDRGTRGVVINSVIEDSPAEDAGLRSNDVITAVAGERVRDFEDLQDIMGDYEPGDDVTVDVVRGDRERSFDVRLGHKEDSPNRFMFFDRGRRGDDEGGVVIDLDELRDGKWREMLDGDMDVQVDEDDGRIEIIITDEDDGEDRRVIILDDEAEGRGGNRFFWRHDDEGDHAERHERHRERRHWNRERERRVEPPRAPRPPRAPHWVERWDDAAYLGVYTTSMGEQLARYFGVNEGEGVLVEQVVDHSPAEDAGLRAGDVIVRVNGEDVGTPDELRREIRDYEPGDEVNMEVIRDKRKRTVKAKLAEAEDFGMTAPGFMHERRHGGDRLHAELGELHKLRELKPKLHELRKLEPKLRELREELEPEMRELHEHLRELHEALPREELQRLREEVQEEVRRALRERNRAHGDL